MKVKLNYIIFSGEWDDKLLIADHSGRIIAADKWQLNEGARRMTSWLLWWQVIQYFSLVCGWGIRFAEDNFSTHQVRIKQNEQRPQILLLTD